MNLYRIDKVKECIAILDAETSRLKGYINISPFKDILMNLSNEDLGKLRNVVIQDPYITIYAYGSINIQQALSDVRAKLEEITASAPYIIYKIRIKRKPGRKPSSLTNDSAQLKVQDSNEVSEDQVQQEPTPNEKEEEPQKALQEAPKTKKKKKRKKRR